MINNKSQLSYTTLGYTLGIWGIMYGNMGNWAQIICIINPQFASNEKL